MALHRGPKIVTDGLVLCLDAADKKSYSGSGTTWYDRSGNGNHGTLTNGPTFDSGNGGSIDFDGSDDYATITNNSDLYFTNSEWAVGCWLRVEDGIDVTTNYVVFNNESYESSGMIFRIDGASARPYFRTNQSGASTGNTLEEVLSQDTWYNIVISYSSGTVTWYINGVSGGTASITSPIQPTNDFLIGKQSSQCWDGKIAIFNVYQNRSLSAEEVLQNFNAMRGRFGI